METKQKKEMTVFYIPAVIVAIALVFILLRLFRSEPLIFTGTVETTVVNAASLIPGRIDTIMAERGDPVQRGQVLAMLKPDIMNAKIGQAEGVLKAAEGLVEKAEHGAREQQKQAAWNQYQMAKSQFEFAEKTYKRFQMLYADSIISKQEMDELEFKYKAAKEQMKAARAIYEMAKEGARKEDIKSARGKYKQASSVYQEAKAFYDNLKIIAPVSGEISNQIAEVGEVVPSGYPVFTIQVPEKIHALLNVREDYLSLFKKGSVFEARITAIGDTLYKFKVSFLSPLADFATWVPTKDKGEFDLKTFEVHLKPLKPINGLRPGMTIQIFADE